MKSFIQSPHREFKPGEGLPVYGSARTPSKRKLWPLLSAVLLLAIAAPAQMLQSISNSRAAGPKAFSAPGANDHCYTSASSGTTVACTLTTPPATGTVVAVSVMSFTGLTLSTVKDGANTSYILPTNHCESTHDATAGTACVAYLIPGSTGNATITATFTGGTCGACSITVDVFGVSGGTASFTNSNNGNGIANTITAPTLTVSASGTLIWGFCVDASTCSGVNGAWTAEAHGLGTFTEESEYQLSVSSNTAVGFAGGGGGQEWDAMGMTFNIN